METLTTITGREIKVASNKSKRTFTIITTSGKYRTVRQSAEEFRTMERMTGNDWQDFLTYSQDYYPVRQGKMNTKKEPR